MHTRQSPRRSSIFGAFAVIALAVLFGGCATTAPRATFTQALEKPHRIGVTDQLIVKVEASKDVSIEDHEKQRLAQRIKQKIDMKKMNGAVPGGNRDFEIEVLLTQYEKGNAFARFMLAGLGQIHIDSHVSVVALPERTKVGQFDINKTFAWGGIYGGKTSIAEVEEGFAEGVAAAVTEGQQ